MIYAVIDTNVLVSSLISHNPQASTVKVVKYLLSGKITPLFETSILKEYVEVLSREKFKINPSVSSAIVEYIRTNGLETTRTPFENVMIDEDDRVFYEIALTVEDSFLVTGNLKHFPTDPKVVSPEEMLHLLEGE